MATSNEQLIPIGAVADALGVPPVKVATTAERTARWFDGGVALPFSEAARIFEAVRGEQAEADREYIQALEDEPKRVRAEAEKARVAAAQRAAASRVVPGGARLTEAPGGRDWVY